MVKVPSGARKSRFSPFPEGRIPLLPVCPVDQTPPSSTDHPTKAPRHPPTLGYLISAASLTATHPKTRQNNPVALQRDSYRPQMEQRPQCPHSRTPHGISRHRRHRFQLGAALRSQQVPASHLTTRFPPPGRTQSGATTPCFKSHNPFHYDGYTVYSCVHSQNVRENTRRPLRKSFHSPTSPNLCFEKVKS